MARTSTTTTTPRTTAVDKGTVREKAKQADQKEVFSLDSLSGVKILETGTWVGIALLVVWEIYINSPLFERAAPMAPVVY
eukprot:scaffold2614_cov132-Amphora_coffeaeformis.AAC.6